MTITSPIARSIASAIAYPLRGNVVDAFHAFGATPQGVLRGVVRGDGPMSFSRSSAATVTDFEGLAKTALVNELRYQYSRRVENLEVQNTEQPVYMRAGGTMPPAFDNATTYLGRACASVTFTAASDTAYSGSRVTAEVATGDGRFPVVSGRDYTFSCDVALSRLLVGFEQVTVYYTGAFGSNKLTITAGHAANLTTWSRVSPAVNTFGAGGNNWFAAYLEGSVASDVTLYFTKRHFEDVTGQSDQNPASYVSVGVPTSADLHDDFTDSGVWTPGVNWSVVDSDVIAGAAATDLSVAEMADVGIVAGRTYLVEVTVTDYSAGDFHVHIGGPQTRVFSGNGYDADIVTAGTATTELQIDGGTAFTGKIALTVKELDHGVGVDGVKSLDHENGNTVSGVVVTEAQGAAITDWYALFEPAATNYADGDDDLSGGAETIDLTASGTGDYTLSVYGTAAVTVAAGTATGTGFAQATTGSPVTFNLSVAGTVTLTLDSGTLDTHNGLAMKQVEKADVSSSWIETSGAPETRDADVGNGMFDFLNWNQESGTWLADVWFSALDLGSNQGILSVQNSEDDVLYEFGGHVLSHDGTDFSNVALSPESVDNRFRIVSDFGTGDTLEVGMRDVEGAGAWAWDGSPLSYDGAFTTDSVINIAYGVSVPIGIRDLYGYTPRKGKAWVEANK